MGKKPNKLYPMRMKPCYKDYLWGGELLAKRYKKNTGSSCTAESWELSAHSAGQSVIANGQYAGMPFGDWISEYPGAVSADFSGGRFPVLIKFLDVNTALSVQVHPSDKTACEALGEEGKAEVWYVVDAKPGARIYFGLSREIKRAEFLAHVADGAICEAMRQEEAKSGQIWFITPGTLHSASGGVLMAEIQQSADTTLRAYDFDRLDQNGEKRPLHLPRVCAVMRTKPTENEAERQNESFAAAGYDFSWLFGCEHFRLSRLRVHPRAGLCCGEDSFHALLSIRGEAELVCKGEKYPLNAGDCYFIPAGTGSYSVGGEAECLLTRL